MYYVADAKNVSVGVDLEMAKRIKETHSDGMIFVRVEEYESLLTLTKEYSETLNRSCDNYKTLEGLYDELLKNYKSVKDTTESAIHIANNLLSINK